MPMELVVVCWAFVDDVVTEDGYLVGLT